MRLTTLVFCLAVGLTACAKKPAPQAPGAHTANTTGTTEAPADKAADAPAGAPAPTASTPATAPDDGSHTRGPVPKKSGDPCEGGQ